MPILPITLLTEQEKTHDMKNPMKTLRGQSKQKANLGNRNLLITVIGLIILGSIISFYYLKHRIDNEQMTVSLNYDVLENTTNHKTTIFLNNALRGEYSPDGTQILFYRKTNLDDYAIYAANADGTGIHCITCTITAFAGLNVGGGTWHPSMKYIAFHVEKAEHFVHPGSEILTHPGIGWYSDIYIMRLSDKKIERVTNLPTKTKLFDTKPYTAVLHPHFSHDGKRISWGQSPDMTIRGWYGWEIALADFNYNETNFKVTNIQTIKPNNINGYYESDDFSLDDNKLLICGNLQKKQAAITMDLYEYDMRNNTLRQLTNSSDWDETPLYSPDNTKIAWLSSNGLNSPTDDDTVWWKNGRTEFWVMNSDGTNKHQITSFNTPGTADYALVGGRRTIAQYIDWHPDGKHLIGTISISKEPATGYLEKLVLIELE